VKWLVMGMAAIIGFGLYEKWRDRRG